MWTVAQSMTQQSVAERIAMNIDFFSGREEVYAGGYPLSGVQPK